jgi:putative DNA-invertase from lambdoid prophage Rac
MFRSASDALGTLEEMKEQRISLHMIDLGGDVCGNGISKLVFTILSAVAENERDRIRERIRDVKRHLASQGVYGGGNKPFGYDVVDGRLVPNMAEQKALANMRKLRAAGMSFQKIGEEHGKKGDDGKAHPRPRYLQRGALTLRCSRNRDATRRV